MPERSKKILIVGCGYRGKRIAVRLMAQGYAVRGLTRSSDHAAALQKVGIEPVIGDVERVFAPWHELGEAEPGKKPVVVRAADTVKSYLPWG